jgi:hypothetical protein
MYYVHLERGISAVVNSKTIFLKLISYRNKSLKGLNALFPLGKGVRGIELFLNKKSPDKFIEAF